MSLFPDIRTPAARAKDSGAVKTQLGRLGDNQRATVFQSGLYESIRDARSLDASSPRPRRQTRVDTEMLPLDQGFAVGVRGEILVRPEHQATARPILQAAQFSEVPVTDPDPKGQIPTPN